MKHVVEEQLSAFLDGELPDAEAELLLRRLDQDSDSRARLGRYALIGQLLRGDSALGGGAVLATRISAAVAAEAAHVQSAPRARRHLASLATAGIAAAAGLVVLAGLLSLGTFTPPQAPVASAPMPAPAPNVRPADFRSPAHAPIEPDRLTAYLVAHGDVAGGLSRQVVSSHVVTGAPDFLVASARGVPIDE
jgi:negative regulator of sigma E activity